MNKYFHRFVALLLVPSLISDPVTAVSLSSEPLFGHMTYDSAVQQDPVFDEQAIPPSLLEFIPSLIPLVGIHHRGAEASVSRLAHSSSSLSFTSSIYPTLISLSTALLFGLFGSSFPTTERVVHHKLKIREKAVLPQSSSLLAVNMDPKRKINVRLPRADLDRALGNFTQHELDLADPATRVLVDTFCPPALRLAYKTAYLVTFTFGDPYRPYVLGITYDDEEIISVANFSDDETFQLAYQADLMNETGRTPIFHYWGRPYLGFDVRLHKNGADLAIHMQKQAPRAGEPLAIAPRTWWGRLYHAALNLDIKSWLEDPKNRAGADVLQHRYPEVWEAVIRADVQQIKRFIEEIVAPAEETREFLGPALAAFHKLNIHRLTQEAVASVLKPFFDEMRRAHEAFFLYCHRHLVLAMRSPNKREVLMRKIAGLESRHQSRFVGLSPAHRKFPEQFEIAQQSLSDDHYLANIGLKPGDPLLIAGALPPAKNDKGFHVESINGVDDMETQVVNYIQSLHMQLEADPAAEIDYIFGLSARELAINFSQHAESEGDVFLHRGQEPNGRSYIDLIAQDVGKGMPEKAFNKVRRGVFESTLDTDGRGIDLVARFAFAKGNGTLTVESFMNGTGHLIRFGPSGVLERGSSSITRGTRITARFYVQDKAAAPPAGSGNIIDPSIASNHLGGHTRAEHVAFHERGEFEQVIHNIVRWLRLKRTTVVEIPSPNGAAWYNFRTLLSQKTSSVLTVLDGQNQKILPVSKGATIRQDLDGIVIIIDPAFKEDHAGRSGVVLARDERMARHELAELRFIAMWVVRKGIARRTELQKGLLGKKIRDWLNDARENNSTRSRRIDQFRRVMDEADAFGLAAEESENAPVFPPGYAEHALGFGGIPTWVSKREIETNGEQDGIISSRGNDLPAATPRILNKAA